MVKLTIDGKAVEVPQGTTVYNAAKEAGSFIPVLCHHPQLAPYGGCRMCMVEVEGARTLQPSCTLPASEGMVVKTGTDKVLEARKFVLSMIFSERNHFCMYCQVSGGDCELQNAAYHEGMTNWPLQPNWQPFEVDASHKYFVLDNNRCILCRRCVRACGELVGNFTLGFEERGANSMLVADYGIPLAESSCISCGTCVQICPTGALIDRQSAYQGKEVDVEHHIGVCDGCSIGCTRDVLTRDNRLVRIEGDWDAPLNQGLLCDQGRFVPVTDERNRIITPLIRKDGSLKATTLDEALELVSQKIKTEKDLSAVVSSRFSAEAMSLFKEVFASAKVSCLDEAANMNSIEAAKTLGKAYEAKLDCLKDCDAVLVFDTDLVADHQVAGFFVKRQIPNGCKIITVENKPSALSEKATLKLSCQKGNSLEIIKGLTATLVKLGSESVDGMNADETLKSACEATGISKEELYNVASVLISAKKPAFVFGNSLSTSGIESILALVKLAESCNASIVDVKGGANSLVASALDLYKSFNAAEAKTVYLALGDEQPTQKLVKDLENANFLIVQSAYASQLTAKADVVLPVANWAEQSGTFLNLAGDQQKAEKALEAPENVPGNAELLQALANKLGLKTQGDWATAVAKATLPVETAK